MSTTNISAQPLTPEQVEWTRVANATPYGAMLPSAAVQQKTDNAAMSETIDWSDVTKLEATRLRSDGERIVRPLHWLDPVQTGAGMYTGARVAYWISGAGTMRSDAFRDDGTPVAKNCDWRIRPRSPAPSPPGVKAEGVVLPSGEVAGVGSITSE